MRPRPSSTTIETPDEGYFASFTDMLVGILFIFIILLMIVANNYQEATQAVKEVTEEATERKVQELQAQISQEQQKAVDAAQRALDMARTRELWKRQEDLFFADRAKILKQIEQYMKEGGVPVAVDVNQGVVRMPEQLLFSANEDAVNEQGKQILAVLAGALGSYLPCITPTGDASRLFNCNFVNLSSNDGLDAVFIVDNPALNGSAEQKWLLSVQRSIALFRGLTAYDPYLDAGLRNIAGVPVINAAAKKERRLLKQQNSVTMHNTVEIWFKMRTPTPADITKLKEAGGENPAPKQ